MSRVKVSILPLWVLECGGDGQGEVLDA